MSDAREWIEELNAQAGGDGSVEGGLIRTTTAALLAVFGLHVETAGPSPMWDDDGRQVTWCAYCADLSNGEMWSEIEWPCTTVRAITEALEVSHE